MQREVLPTSSNKVKMKGIFTFKTAFKTFYSGSMTLYTTFAYLRRMPAKAKQMKMT